MPFRPSPRQLEYLVALDETGHFGRAARRCNVSQPTLSVQVGVLEDQIGQKLVERRRDGACLTPAGARVVRLAREALATLDRIVAVGKGAETNLGGLIRLGVAPTFGPYLMPFALPVLHARWPGLEVHIREDRPDDLDSAVLSAERDCAVGPRPLEPARFEYREFVVEELFVGVPGDDPLAQLDVLPLRALEGRRMLTLGRGHRLNERIQALCDICGAVPRAGYEGTSLDALRQMVSIGMGCTLFPALYVASEFSRASNVALKRIEGRRLERSVGAYWRAGHVRSDHFAAFAEVCAGVAGERAAALTI